MEQNFSALHQCAIFKHFQPDELSLAVGSLDARVRSYVKGTSIAFEGENCSHIGILLEGDLELHNLYPSGRTVTVTHLSPGDTFGEAILFTPQHTYPVNITAISNCKIMFVQREALLEGLRSNPKMLENFLNLLSGKLFMLNRRVRILSMDSIRQKLCHYMIALYKQQHSKTLVIPVNRQKLSELLGVQRPSLSRELINMKEEGLIEYDKRTIQICDMDAIEAEL